MSSVDSCISSDESIEYFRYVDDILVLCRGRDADRILELVGAKCAEIGLQVHPLAPGSKTQVGQLTGQFEYLGYVFSPTGVTVRPHSVQKLENTIARLFTDYKYQSGKNPTSELWQEQVAAAFLRRLDLVITGCIHEGIPRGWMHYFSQMNDLTLLGRLDAYVVRMIRRFALPASTIPKRFVKTYWQIVRPRYGSESYIPNFDRFDTIQKLEFLLVLFPTEKKLRHLSPEELEGRFRAEVRRLISMLERDVSETS